jgi:hypothetical protein
MDARHRPLATCALVAVKEFPMTTSTPNFFGGFDLAADKLLAEGINNYIAVNGTLNGGGEATSGVVLPLGDTGDFQARDTGDFFGDEFSDIAFWNPITGRVDIWDINDATGAHTVVSLTDAAGNLAVVTGATGWQLLETNGFDPDADGRADLLWWNPTFGAVDWWDLNVDPANPGVYTPYTLASGVLSSTWSYEGIGDFDGDYISLGKGGLKGDDVLWVNETTGLVAWWQIGGGAGLTNVTSEPHDFILFPGGRRLRFRRAGMWRLWATGMATDGTTSF